MTARPPARSVGAALLAGVIAATGLALTAESAPSRRSDPNASPAANGSADPNTTLHPTTAPPRQGEAAQPDRQPPPATGGPADPNAAPAGSGDLQADPLAAARRSLAEDRFEEALSEARRLADADPNSAAARTLLGDALYRRGDFEDAEAAYRAGIALDPNHAAAHFGAGRIARTLGRYGEAGESFHRASALAPDNAKYLRTLSNHLARRQDTIVLLERYLELPPAEDEGIIRNVRAWIELLKFLGEEPLGEIVRAEPTDLPLNVLRGQAYLKAGINEAAGQRFAFDTGATGITVSPRLAKTAKLKVIRPFTITAMGGKGTVRGDLVLIKTLTVGGVTIRNVAATVADPAGPEEGLMGPSVFGGFRITVDLEGGTLSLRAHGAAGGTSPGGAADPNGGRPPDAGSTPAARGAAAPSPGAGAPGAVVLPFRNVGGQIVVRADLNGTPLNAMVDTGSSSSLASLTSVPRVAGLELLPGDWIQGRSMGLGGGVARKALRAATLSFAGREFKADGLPCVDLSRFSRALESEVYLVVGFPELSRFILTIDYRAMSLTLAPRER